MKLRILPPPSTVRALLAFAGLSVFAAGCTESKTDDPQPVTPPTVAVELGRVTETEIEIKLSAKDADRVAYYVVEATDAASIPDAATVFELGESSQAFETPESFEILDLKSGTAYTVYAAASKGDTYSEVASVDATTDVPVVHELITDVQVSGLSVSYNIDLQEGYTCYHAYIEKWYYDLALMFAMQTAGPEFDRNAFMYNLLSEVGVPCEVSGQFVWTAGEDHPIRRTVSLTPGKDYYVIAASFVNESWTGEPSLIPFTMPESKGVSAEDIDISIDDLTTESVTLRMACDETKIAFFFYDLYEKSQFDAFKAEKGERGMMDYLFEYNDGNVSGNTYTDKWIVDSGKSYVLALYGVDYNGCEIYKEFQVDVPVPTPVLALDIIPYDRELQGYHDYDTFLMSFEPLYFTNELNVDRMFCSVMPMEKAMFDEYMGMFFGLSGASLGDIEQLLSQQEYFYMFYSYMSTFYVNPIYDDAEIDSLTKNGYFERVFTGLNADTEYVFIAVAFDGDTPVVRLASAKTAAYPESAEASDGYKAFLGNWTVLGQTTADWTSYENYNLRIEELTPNRSFKVYGWSRTSISQEFPFVMRYHPETGKVSVDGPQVLGKKTVDGKEMDVVFIGKMYASGYDKLVVILGYNGPVYTGSLNGDNLSMFGEMIKVGGRDKEFMSMNYMLQYEDDNYYVAGDEEDLVYFRISRAAASAFAAKGVSPLRSSSCKVGSVKYSELRYDVPSLSSVVNVPAVRVSSNNRHAKLQGVAKFAK